MNSFALFLHGTYGRRDLPFYKALAKGRFCIAVDGGLSFFQKTGLKPRMIVGDFDSIRRDPRREFPKSEIAIFPVNKDKTDTQLAVESAIKNGATAIDLVQPIFGEADHFTGNLLLLASLVENRRNRHLKLRLVNAAYEIIFLRDGTCVISGSVGDTVSVVPLTPSITLNCVGTAFPADRLRVKRGETVALRNKITSKRATIAVRGQAFLFHQFSSRSR